MKRLLTAGIFGTILGIVGTGTANASIVSSGFLDEKLTEYALSTSLDLKANQSDLTNLSNIVGTPAELTYRDMMRRGSEYIANIMGDLYYNTYADNTVPTNDISELIRLNYTDSDFPGLAGVVLSLFERRDPADQWPLRLRDIFNDYEFLYGDGYSSFMDLIIRGGTVSARDGFVTVYGLKDLTTKVDTNTDKIGTLPSGNFPDFPGYGHFFFDLEQPLTYPTSLAELINAIYGNSETGQIGLLERIIAGIPFDTDGDGRFDSNAGTLPNFELAKNANDLANTNATKIDSIETKIGTLPTEYATVGAALTAIKGIAEDAKAAALAAIPDPKQEGSSGKFVLTVDIVGDNATYHWEKIDREGETTTTTE